MGDAKRRRIATNNYCLKPSLIDRHHFLAGASPEIQQYFTAHYEGSINQKRIAKKIQEIIRSHPQNQLQGKDRIIIAPSRDNDDFIIAVMADWLDLIETQFKDNFTITTIPDLQQLLRSYNHERQLAVVSTVSTAPGLPSPAHKNFLSVELFTFELRNIYC
jgi:hypothetical protein